MLWKRHWRSKFRKVRAKSPFRKISRTKLIKYLAIGAFGLLLFGFLCATILFAWYSKDLPTPDKIVRKEGFSTKIYDRNNVPLYDVFVDQRRTPVEWEDIPDYLKKATIAIEDKNFYKHQGFDPTGWMRAVYNIALRGRLQGGSTLTQQLVKNVLLTSERTLVRKIKEFVLAVQIEKKYSKDEILRMYLNEAPYGGTAWGVGVAAETYFGKKVKDLNLVESAILAGLPQQPSYFSPFSGYPKAYIDRTKDVLRRMGEENYLNKDEEQQAVAQLEEIKFTPSDEQIKAPHFVMYVKKLLEDTYGEKIVEQGGLQVYTTLDWELQKKAQEIVTEEIKKVESLHITNGASMVMDPQNGEILAMVGSKDFLAADYDGQVNVCLSSRQPGSAIKPVSYVTAFRKGYTPATMIVDVITHFPGGAGRPDYIPKNYDGKAHGPVQLRYALGSSLNIPSVKLLALVGLENTLKTAYDLGLTTLEPTSENISRLGLSFTLGGGEVRLLDLTAAYSAFANSGLKVSPVAILEVKDQKGKTLDKHKSIPGKRVLTEEEAFLINNILSDNEARLITFGPNSLLNITSRSVAVKTGTTDDMKDNWTIGWTPGKIVGVWVGNNDNTSMKAVASGTSGASPIWRQILLEALKKDPIQEFKMPSNIISKEVDKISGYPSHDGWQSRNEFFIKGTEPTGTDPIHTKLRICKSDNNKLAPETIIAKGDFEEKEFIVLKEEDPGNKDKNRWQEGIDAWLNEQQDSRYHFPKEYCSASNEVIVRFKKPADQDQVGNEFEVEVEVAADYQVKNVKFYANDNEEKALTERPFRTKLVLGNGVYNLKARAEDEKGNSGETQIKIGVNVSPKETPVPSPSPSPSPMVSPSLSPEPTPSPLVSPSP